MSENGLTGHPPPLVAHSCFHSTQILVQEVHTPPRPYCCCARSCIGSQHNWFPSSDLLSAIRCRLLLGWLAWPLAVRQSGRSSQPGRMGCFTVPQVVVLSGRRPSMASVVLLVSLRSDALKCCGRCRDSCAMGSRLMRPATHLLFGVLVRHVDKCAYVHHCTFSGTLLQLYPRVCVACMCFVPATCHPSHSSTLPSILLYVTFDNGRCKQLSVVSLASSLYQNCTHIPHVSPCFPPHSAAPFIPCAPAVHPVTCAVWFHCLIGFLRHCTLLYLECAVSQNVSGKQAYTSFVCRGHARLFLTRAVVQPWLWRTKEPIRV